MKLTEKPTRNRRSKAGEVLGMEPAAETDLNERIGMTPELKAELLSLLDPDTANSESPVERASWARYLLILFPEEQAAIKARVNIEALVKAATNPSQWKDQLEALYNLAEFDSERLASLKLSSEDKKRFLDLVFASDGDKRLTKSETIIRQLVFLRRIFGAEASIALDTNHIRKVEEFLSLLPTNAPWSAKLTSLAYWYSRYDPTQYQHLHEMVRSREQEVKRACRVLLTVLEAQPCYYATFKTMLADNVEFTWDGNIRIVDQQKLKVSPPLPERSLA